MGFSREDSLGSRDGSWSSKEPLVEHPDEDIECGSRNPRRSRFQRAKPYLFHFAIFISYTVLFLVGTRIWPQRPNGESVAYSPASKAVKHHKVSFDGNVHASNPYRGEPSPELDQAWSDLLQHTPISITEDELRRMNRTSNELYDDVGNVSGYNGLVSVYHHLHCLKYIRHAFHSDYYGIENHNLADQAFHIDHCFDDIRQALMCNADTSVVTFEWKPDYRRPWPNFAVEKTCVDWEALDKWAGDRSFQLYDQHSLVHPQLGLVYPLINGEYEDVSHGPAMHIVWPDFHPSESPNS